jgi:hypothetical protein
VRHEKQLTSLLTPRLGDSLIQPDGVPWLDALGKNQEKLDIKNLNQIAALPLGSRLRTDPWDDKVIPLNAPAPLILNPGDKMPFDVTPVYLRLQYYQAPAAAPAPTAAPAAPGAAAPSENAAVPGADTNPPAAAGTPPPTGTNPQ